MSEGRDRIGPFLGILTFLCGIVLLALTFSYAFYLYSNPPTLVLGIGNSDGKPVDLNKAGDSVAGVVFRSIMLLVMCAVGSSIAGRGIKLYAASAGFVATPKKEDIKNQGDVSTRSVV